MKINKKILSLLFVFANCGENNGGGRREDGELTNLYKQNAELNKKLECLTKAMTLKGEKHSADLIRQIQDLQERIDNIQAAPEKATKEDLANLSQELTALQNELKTRVGQDVIDALKIKEYAKAADLQQLQGRLSSLQGALVTKANIDKAIEDALKDGGDIQKAITDTLTGSLKDYVQDADFQATTNNLNTALSGKVDNDVYSKFIKDVASKSEIPDIDPISASVDDLKKKLDDLNIEGKLQDLEKLRNDFNNLARNGIPVAEVNTLSTEQWAEVLEGVKMLWSKAGERLKELSFPWYNKIKTQQFCSAMNAILSKAEITSLCNQNESAKNRVDAIKEALSKIHDMENKSRVIVFLDMIRREVKSLYQLCGGTLDLAG